MENRYTKGILGIIIACGVIVGAYLLFLSNIQSGDFQAYYFAAKAALNGEAFIGREPPTAVNTDFVYPPIAIILFLPFGVFESWGQAYLLQILIILAFGISTIYLIVSYLKYIGVDLDRLDIFLISGAILLGAHSIWTFAHGQMNLHLLFLITLGYISHEKRRSIRSGLGFAFAAVIKIFPALYGIWLLKEKDYRAVGAAIVTGLSMIILSILIFGIEPHLQYIEYLAADRSRIEEYRGGMSPTLPMVTLNRPLSVLFPNAPELAFSIVPVLLLAPAITYIYFHSEDEIDRLVTFLATTIAIILIMPSNQYYVSLTLFPLIPLLYLVNRDASFRFLSVGAIIANAPFAPDHLETVFQLIPIPTVLESVTLSILTPILTFGSVPLYGLLLILLGCIIHVSGESGPINRRFR